ncbi:hypothetical protein HELRODRAFT_164285 [Helobdella robusta]|uniref:Zinc finger PHD-type domain-containing protein n=1 Tax=Helobdella robusta TaxID=6412 RepID=T1EV75_HELRO|nr:hypothetical protein HELRODRAFT_164285 [Helobdella robusta]ESN94441.1 hypothetical protein HELRODRAFT_164285 [Helobdella robusta]
MSIKGCQCARNMEDKDAIQCFQCQLAFHQDCVGISKSAFKVISSVSNIKWYCDECMKLLPDVKSLNKAVRDSNHALNTKIDKIDESNNLLRSELEAIKSEGNGGEVADRQTQRASGEVISGEGIADGAGGGRPFNSSSADTLLNMFNSEIVRIVDMVAPCRYVKSTHVLSAP